MGLNKKSVVTEFLYSWVLSSDLNLNTHIATQRPADRPFQNLGALPVIALKIHAFRLALDLQLQRYPS